MTEKEKISEWIDRYNRNDLKGDELTMFIELVRNNPELRRELAVERELQSILEDEDLISFREKLEDAAKRKKDDLPGLRILSVAASVFLFSILALVLAFFTRRMEHDLPDNTGVHLPGYGYDSLAGKRNRYSDISENKKDTVNLNNKLLHERKKPRRQYASNYKPFPPFEHLSGTALRSGMPDIELPARESYLKGEKIPFPWKGTVNDNIKLLISDNRGTLVLECEWVPGKSIDVDSGKLPYGLYYYKIIRDGKMIYLGKFEIE